jgi:hypothetical protein
LFACLFFETESGSIVQAVLELEILLPQPPECCLQKLQIVDVSYH